MLFWKNWPSPYKQFIWGLTALAALCLMWFAYYYLPGTESIIGWDILAKTEHINVPVDTFKIGPFSLSTSAENPIFFQQYSGSTPQINVTSYYLLLIIVILCLNVLFAIVSTLSRFWYFAGTALFAFALVNFKLELLLLFGSEDKWGLILALALFLPASYYFNNIDPTVTFLRRLITFLLITAILSIAIAVFSHVDAPFLYMATYGMINPLMISLIFILIVAHEIIAAFIRITGTGISSGGSALLHFYIITTVYLVNLILAYLYEINLISWNIIYINLFLLLFISAILGLWGFAQRENQYKHLFNFYPFGAMFFLAMAACCFMTIGHFTATFNDPAIEVLRDFIIYAHLSYGVIFVVYITSNFLDPLRRNMKVYKVLYKPTTMPYFTFRLAGLIAFIALVMKSNWEVPVNQATSAYFNGIGDLHYNNQELLLAKSYYEEGAVFGFQNHKSHYMLAKLAMDNQDDVHAAVYYKTATAKNPTPQSYINLSNIYMEQARFFDALFTLNEGLETFPGNAEILNNIGVAYTKTAIVDTAAYYLHHALEGKNVKSTAGSNILALLAKHDLNLSPDTVLRNFKISANPILLNNSFVIKNLSKEPLKQNFVPEDSTLTFLEASILYNEAFNHLFSASPMDISKLDGYAGAPQNLNFRENLRLVTYLNLYKDNNVNEAFRQLNWLANVSTFRSGRYFNLLGLWALEQEAPDVAVDYFTWAADRNLNEARLNLAIALTENQKIEKAATHWNELLETGDREVKRMAQNLLRILNATTEEYPSLSDQQKYLYTRYTVSYRDTTRFDQLIKHIENNNYRGWAILTMSEKLWIKDMTGAAINYYGRLSGLKITDQRLFNHIQWYELKMLAAQRNVRGLSSKINQGVHFDEDHLLHKRYFTALINEASGDTTSARQHYEFIAYRNPFLEEATIAAARFIGMDDKLEAYNILLNAIEINPRSVKLLKAYILQAVRMRLNNYAEHGLEDLKPLLPTQAYREFTQDYHRLMEQVAKMERSF